MAQSVPGMLRAYKFVNMPTQMVHIQTCIHTDCSQTGFLLCPLLINVQQVDEVILDYLSHTELLSGFISLVKHIQVHRNGSKCLKFDQETHFRQ